MKTQRTSAKAGKTAAAAKKTTGKVPAAKPVKNVAKKSVKKAATKAAKPAAKPVAKAVAKPAARPAKPAVPPKKRTLVLGTRGSKLALTQSGMVKEWLEKANPGLEVRLEVIRTAGDADQGTPLDTFPALGVFVKELQTALLEGRVDAAVHSLKDVPEEQPEGLVLAAYPEREDARDVFVSRGFKDGVRFADLPKGARVGTGSPRRILQLRALRPDLEFVPLRGNVDTRVAKLERGEVDGLVLAAAGLRRLGRTEVITHTFSYGECIPAIGQAALGLECRADDAATRKCLEKLNDPETADAVELERQFMQAVGGGCKVPMAAHAYPHGDSFRFLAVMGDAATGRHVRIERVLDPEYEEEDVDELAEEILELCRDKGLPTPREVRG